MLQYLKIQNKKAVDNMHDLGTKTIETERLLLRKIEENDYVKMYHNWAKDDRVSKYVVWLTHQSPEDTKKIVNFWVEDYNNSHVYRWIVIEKETNEPIGTIDVVKSDIKNKTGEIGYCYGYDWWGKGYATEALKSVIDYLFNEVGFKILTADYLVENPASGKVMQKAGMKYKEKNFKDVFKNGVDEELIVYEITKE